MKPSIPGVVGGALRIKKFYISMGSVYRELLRARKIRKTTYQDYFIRFQGRIVAWTVFYRDYRGFYLDRNYQNSIRLGAKIL
ncbi:MAG: hypothetical protein IPJ32_08215 [Sphingobacteriaceae bacterium]|nr:hypothetical protein [Sphingobacteriaceae bacterium]